MTLRFPLPGFAFRVPGNGDSYFFMALGVGRGHLELGISGFRLKAGTTGSCGRFLKIFKVLGLLGTFWDILWVGQG